MVLSASSVTALHREGSSWFYFSRQLIGARRRHRAVPRHRRRRLPRLAPVRGACCTSACSALLVAVLVPGVGVNVNGSSRWVDLGFLQLQPSEFAKLTTLLVVRRPRAPGGRRGWRRAEPVLHPALVWFGIVALLLMTQPNLGTTLVLGVTVFAVLFCAGVPGASLGPVGAVGVRRGASAGAHRHDYRRARLLAFLDPWADPGSTGYQTIQSQVSLGSGGWFGVGLGEGRQKWGFLPEAHTDFIFAIIGEELGLLGALLRRRCCSRCSAILGIRAAAQAPDTFGRLLATGITTWFCVQAFVNLGAVIGILPDHRRARSRSSASAARRCWRTWPRPASSATSAAPRRR